MLSVGLDPHKRYSQVEALEQNGGLFAFGARHRLAYATPPAGGGGDSGA